MKMTQWFSFFNRIYPHSSNNNNQIYSSLNTTTENNLLNVISNGVDFCITHVECFLNLINENLIKEFLEFDQCCKIADKYLLSMVFVYFIRAKLPCHEYSSINFFAALYLAHDMEEDDEDLKDHIMRWALGRSRVGETEYFLQVRDNLWFAMDYRACVSLHCCQQVWNSCPNSSLWLRERSPTHAGARRIYDSEEECSVCQDDQDQDHYHGSCGTDYVGPEDDSDESGCDMEVSRFEEGDLEEEFYFPQEKIVRISEE